MASSREAAARSVSEALPLYHALEVRSEVPEGGAVSIPWVEVQGRVGTAELFEADVVIALDMSIRANFPSGLDLDEDGVVGELRGVVRAVGSYVPRHVLQADPPPLPPSQWTTDVDDTVAALEIAAARAITSGLAQRRNRVGVLSYSHRGRVRCEVGPPDSAMASLDALEPASGTRGTDIYAALRRAREMLEEAPELPGFRRQRAVLLFTDGQPVEPVDRYIARIRAKAAAVDLARAGIDLYVFTLGSINLEQAKFLLELAGAGDGRIYRVVAPERMLDDLPPVDLTPVWLRIENATTGKPAQGVETRSDGSFRAFVPLAPGENRLRVLAERGDGKLQRWEGRVVHEPGPDGVPEPRAETQRVLRLIEQRESGGDDAQPGDSGSDAAAAPPGLE